MTTPRVTVPVDERPAFQVINDLFAKHGLDAPPWRLRDQLVDHLLSHRSYYSAAPAPEGAADNDDRITYSRLARALSCHPTVMVVERSDPTLELTAKSLEDTLEEVLPLATREEAPESRLVETLSAASAKVSTNPKRAAAIRANWTNGEEPPAGAGERPFFPSGENGLIGFSLKAARVLRTMLNARDLKEGVAVADELIADLEAALRAQPPARSGEGQ